MWVWLRNGEGSSSILMAIAPVTLGKISNKGFHKKYIQIKFNYTCITNRLIFNWFIFTLHAWHVFEGVFLTVTPPQPLTLFSCKENLVLEHNSVSFQHPSPPKKTTPPKFIYLTVTCIYIIYFYRLCENPLFLR